MRRFLPVLLPVLGLLLVVFALAPREGRADGKAKATLMDDATRAAIDRGLRWLVRNQQTDGSWICDAGNKVNEISDVATLLNGESAGGAKAALPGATAKPVTERPAST